MGGRFDLHVHTTASDGLLEPEAVVAQAKERGLICIAITDHDTAGGVARACAARIAESVERIARAVLG